MKLFLKYFFFGWLGLILSLSFPQLRISWLAILLAWGYVRHGSFLAIPLIVLLALVYSFFSVAGFWFLLIPLLLNVLLLEGLKKHFSLPNKIRLGIALLLFWGSPWWLEPSYIYQEIVWGVGTLLGGFFVPPCLKRISFSLEATSPWRSRGTVIRDSAWGLGKRGRGSSRRPFGFEREMF